MSVSREEAKKNIKSVKHHYTNFLRTNVRGLQITQQLDVIENYITAQALTEPTQNNVSEEGKFIIDYLAHRYPCKSFSDLFNSSIDLSNNYHRFMNKVSHPTPQPTLEELKQSIIDRLDMWFIEQYPDCEIQTFMYNEYKNYAHFVSDYGDIWFEYRFDSKEYAQFDGENSEFYFPLDLALDITRYFKSIVTGGKSND